MSYTVEDVDRVISAFDGEYDDGWMYLKYLYPTDKVEPSEIGEIRRVDGYGGEGQGDDYWVVISVTDSAGAVRWFKRYGCYQSYCGGELDGPTDEVKPIERTVTFYE